MDKVEEVFFENNGYAIKEDFKKAKISDYYLNKYITDGKVIRVKNGYYKWHKAKNNEIAILGSFYREGVMCMNSALFHYAYIKKMPDKWHMAFNKDISKAKFNMPNILIKPYYYEPKTLKIGISTEVISGMFINVYNRDRLICDVLRYREKLDENIFKSAIKEYIKDDRKNKENLKQYSKKLNIENKVNQFIQIWL